MKYSPNGRALDRSVKLSGRGSAYIFENDEFDNPVLTSTDSLGYNNSVDITFNKETEDSEHTNFDVKVIEETRTISMAPTCNMNFSEFATSVIARYLNSKVVKNAAGTKTIDITVKAENITEEKGFFYPIDGAIDTVVITFGPAGATTAIAGVHYTVQNGSIAFHSLARQTALGAATLLDPTSANVLVNIEVETLAGEAIEFETDSSKSYGLYIEIYSTFKRKTYLHQIWIHKVNVVIDTLPLKQEDDAANTYDVTFNILASTAITDPTKSKYFRKVTSELPAAA